MTKQQQLRPSRFQPNDIMSLTEETPEFDLAESVGPDLMLDDLADLSSTDFATAVSLGYGTTQGNKALRQAIAHANGDLRQRDIIHSLVLQHVGLKDFARDQYAVI